MTELTITPKTADKTARFKGAVAAGEHVAVTIKGGAAWLGDDNREHLSLRVLDLVTGRTLAVFPRPPETLDEGEEPDEWDTAVEDDRDLFCNLNLNTDRMVNAARHMLRVPVLFVMGAKDEENPATTRTLYFRDRYEVEFWPERVGDDTPYDLDKWPKQIDEWTRLVADWNARLDRMKLSAQRSTDEPPPADVPYTTITLNRGADGETDTVVKVYDGKNGEDGQDGQTTHAWVKERFLALAGGTMAGAIVFPVSGGAQQSITAGSGGVIVTDGAQVYEFTRSGNVAGPGTVARFSDVTPKYEKPQGGIPKTDLATAVQTSLGKADTALQASDITGKADKATTYTKAEVDAIVAALKTGSRQIVASLSDVTSPQPLVIYMVAKSAAQTSNAYDEFIWVDVNGVGRWEKIGDTEIDLSGYVQKEAGKGLFSGAYADLTGKPTLEDAIVRTSSNAVKSSGIWSAIWGTLTSLPTGFTALYDWVVAQLDAKLNTSGGRVTGDVLMNRGSAVVFGDANGPAVYSGDGTTLKADTRGTTGAVALLSDIPAVPAAYTSSPEKDGAASAGTPGTYACGNHRHPTDTSRQAKLSQTQLNNIAAVPNKLDSSVTDAYSFAVDSSGHLMVTDSQSGAVYTFAGPVRDPGDVARGEDLPYVTGVIMDESEGVYFPRDRAVNSYEATDGDTTLTLGMPQPMPVDQGGRARDFILDVDNSANSSALGIEFNLLGEDYALAVTDGDDLAEITELAAGERARFYFTETAQRYDSIPVISIQRMTIEVVTTQGGA